MSLRPTRAEISLEALAHNFAIVRELAGDAGILAIVKAEAYGHGLVRMAGEFVRLGADWLGVSFLEEGIALRKSGIDLPILVLGAMADEQIGDFLDNDLTITVSSVWKAHQVEEDAAARGIKARVHLKIDTGMGRVGQSWETAGLLFDAVARLRHLEVEGVYTHFASAEAEDLTFARTQLERFHLALDEGRRIGLEFPLIHCANSGALVQMTEQTRFNLVRPGILLYGHPPSEHLLGKYPLHPVMSLKTKVVFVKRPPAGTPIGYGSTWHSPGNRWIATLPIGYGDGYPRRTGNKANVLLRSRRCPIVGNISMDQLTIDAGDEAFLGDEVVLWGGEGDGQISIWELCRSINAIPYELLCGLTARVPRIYL